jgi:dihydroxyacetone kinase phosphotransfer subunit
MVGLVIVSHSQVLAKSLKELAQQVASSGIPIATAGGVGPGRTEFGTDASEISQAIQSVYSPDGVVVLMDLGSAVLSAQMALDLLPAEVAKKVVFCAAPLVEGSIVAAVQIGLGSDAQTVCREAMRALRPKQEQLGAPAEGETAATAVAGEGEAGETHQVTLVLKNAHGLHARPAARFVQTAASFNAEILVRNESSGRGPVPAKSLNAVVALGAGRGDKITLLARGRDAQKALHELARLADESFGEPG